MPFTHFLRMETPVFKAAPPDTALEFRSEPIKNSERTSWLGANWMGAISLNGEGTPIVAIVSGAAARLSNGASLPFPNTDTASARSSVLSVDLNYDFKTDLVFAGAGGVRIFRQEPRRSLLT